MLLVIKRIYDNNSLLVSLGKGREAIAQGKGIGYKRQKGETISSRNVEKIIYLTDQKLEKFMSLLKDVPLDIVLTTFDVIDSAKNDYKYPLLNYIYVTLTDHVYQMYKRLIAKKYQAISVPNKKGIEYYHKLFKCCLDNGITPYVSLHHFDTPENLFNDGDWLNRQNIDYFVDYADFCFKEFSEVKNWFTINELISLAFSQYIQGNFPPNEHFNVSKAIQAQHNELLAHARVVNQFKKKNYQGRIGLIHVLQPVYPYPDNEKNRHAAELEDAFMNRFLLDGTFKGQYSEKTMSLINEILSANDAKLEIEPDDMDILKEAANQNDYFGLNYYQPSFIEYFKGDSSNTFNGTGEKGTSSFSFKGIGKHVKNPSVPTTDWDWNIYPQGLYEMLKRVATEYPISKTIYITENGLGNKDKYKGIGKLINDDERIDFLDQHVAALLKARSEGVNVQGYFIWSLQDQFSWANGYNKRYGLFYVNFETQAREIKKSALWYRELGNTIIKTE